MKKCKLTRLQVILLNCLFILAVVCYQVVSLPDSYSRTEEQAMEKVLKQIGLTREDITIDYEWQNKYGKTTWRECIIETEAEGVPLNIWFSIHKKGPSRYYSSGARGIYETAEGEYGQTGVISGGRLRQLEADEEGNPAAYFVHVWDFPQLGRENVMKITRPDENRAVLEIDCLNIDVNQFGLEKNPKLFHPELVYEVDISSGNVVQVKEDGRCTELGMILTDEEAAELAARLSEGVYWKKTQ